MVKEGPKLRTHTDIAIKNKSKKLLGHLGKIKFNSSEIVKKYGKRPKGLKNNEIFACACCIEAYNMGKKYQNDKPNTLPV